MGCKKWVEISSQLCDHGSEGPLRLLKRSRLCFRRLRGLTQIAFKGEHPRLQLVFLLQIHIEKLWNIDARNLTDMADCLQDSAKRQSPGSVNYLRGRSQMT